VGPLDVRQIVGKALDRGALRSSVEGKIFRRNIAYAAFDTGSKSGEDLGEQSWRVSTHLKGFVDARQVLVGRMVERRPEKKSHRGGAMVGLW
jgi:hypothetical protein